MSYFINKNTGLLDDDEFSRESFEITIDFIKEWALKMNKLNPKKYNFEILLNINKFWNENNFITQKQYEVLRKFWFKWRIYKTTYFIEDPIEIWFENNHDHKPIHDCYIGFTEQEDYPVCLRKKLI